MNSKFENFKKDIKNKKIDVIGIGISNTPLIKFLAENGASVCACDRRSKDALGDTYNELQKLGVQFCLGDEYLDHLSGDIIFKTPGLRFDNPALLKAAENGARITSEMELFCEFCPAKIIAVTGSDGKTTTTTLIHKMLTFEGYKTWLGGNIGNPLFCSLGDISPDDWVVLELSSFQLHTMKTSPHIAVITNLSPNHLDMHKSYEEYIAAKKNIMLYQNSDDILVVNMDNEVTKKIGDEAKGKIKGFGWDKSYYTYTENGEIFLGGKKIINTADIKIPGNHNIENYMAAITATDGLVSRKTVEYVAKNFGGVEHRIELVRILNGIKFYNSSIDSSPNRTKNTLSVFPEKIVMIAGGKDKGIPYDDIGGVIVEHVKTLILIGATAGKIKSAVLSAPGNESVEIIECDEYKDAVDSAYAHASSGDYVVLSPASTSFDRFKNFEERGNLFKALVNDLK